MDANQRSKTPIQKIASSRPMLIRAFSMHPVHPASAMAKKVSQANSKAKEK
ncbi:MAG: hypothetical protein AB2767_01835 [Candidatus Thiodiazotropha taylori]|nr:hypothetical protein [Candidatus Thiodiazotropha taylori]MCG8070829.1 hypothetical protein [Candidatus Thiodiazotropha taylori]MCW4324842.1 hypothetical protein [Candidatus Thiodiazotropha taylori]